MGHPILWPVGKSRFGEPVVLGFGERDYGEAELAKEDGVFEDGGVTHFGERLLSLEALDGGDADDGIFGVGCVDGEDLGGADRGFAYVGVIDDELFALLHAAEVEQGLGVGDAVPCGLAVAEEVVVGVLVGFGFEEVGHGDKGIGNTAYGVGARECNLCGIALATIGERGCCGVGGAS